MDNLTHSLVGAALAELALPAGAPRAARRTFFATGVIAANLPDADLVYTWITPAPLGSLLHHRGHTHTVAGLALLGVAMIAVCAIPRLRATVEPLRGRLWGLIAVALASHLVLDSWNSYGVHPFWPFTARWFYGDAVYILEPWIWLALGVAAALNTVNRVGRVLLAVALAGLVAFGTAIRVIPVPAAVALVVAGGALWATLRGRTPRTRTAVCLSLTVAFVAGLFALREQARATTLAALAPEQRAGVVDVILSPSPANPLCWSVLTLTRGAAAPEYVMTHGTTSPMAPSGCGRGRTAAVQWDSARTQSIAALRARYREDCWVRGWMQFGRAPEIADGTISDLRYGGVPRGNFTTMELKPLAEAARCPANLTAWRPPRADLLDPSLD